MEKKDEKRKCASCKGTGECSRCGGTGRDPDYDYEIKASPNCRRCNGTGVCPGCHGSGVV